MRRIAWRMCEELTEVKREGEEVVCTHVVKGKEEVDRARYSKQLRVPHFVALTLKLLYKHTTRTPPVTGPIRSHGGRCGSLARKQEQPRRYNSIALVNLGFSSRLDLPLPHPLLSRQQPTFLVIFHCFLANECSGTRR